MTFEKECWEGVISDSLLMFEECCNYVIGLKEYDTPNNYCNNGDDLKCHTKAESILLKSRCI